MIVAPERVTMLDLVGPYEVFSRAARRVPGFYRVLVVACGPGKRVSGKFGLSMTCDLPLSRVEWPVDTVIVAGSEVATDGPEDPALLRWLRKAEGNARRIASVCVGSFHLAQAGLLEGRRATTHWNYIESFRQRFPRTLVEDRPIYTRDGSIYTSAGITAGIDLALALVEEDCGADVASDVARELVVFMQRPGEQSQLSAALAVRMADRDPVRHIQQWVPEHLDRVRSVADLARKAGMSPRNFARRFRAETGTTPAVWLRDLRLEAARRRLVESSDGVSRIAARAGFGSERTLRRVVGQSEGVSPAGYRSWRQAVKGADDEST